MLLLLLFHTTVLLRVLAQRNLTQFGTTRQSSSFTNGLGKPEYAIYPPISNSFYLSTCSYTYLTDFTASAWWMFQFSFGPVYITNITIYYREGFASRMDGFKLYVTNTSTIPPDGYLCYEDTDPGLPNITQTIPCNQLGQYVIYYDNTGSVEGKVVYGPMVELCYIAINDNMAFDSLVAQTPSGSQPANLANDGDKRSCSKTKGFPLIFQVDIKRESIVQGLYITFGEKKEGTHTLYASNTNNAWKSGIILYQGNTLPSEINFNAVFRYLTYVPPVKGTFSELEICEIGIIGCPPSYYGLLCNQSCPGNCDGPCNLKTGNCIFGCLNGWTGDKCEQECPNCHFGRNCSQVCEKCISRRCYPVNGLCHITTACSPGYLYGEYCNKRT
ncbi:MEGF10_11 [Mytilus coruscus]|uniref:MEGF10_11 n=1 Tax=Mytilus coruscus TaxID=42192 RepID=A0A6J8E9M7_MYTCO|nr:MEGF10_11 [Mytilus coruscus]